MTKTTAVSVGYIAGPMTVARRADWNYGEFNRVAGLLRRSGRYINNPAEHFGGDTTLPRIQYLRAAVTAVMESDYVVLLPGWEASPGANLEVDIAIELGLPLFEFRERPDSFSEYATDWYLLPLELSPRRARRVG